MNYKQIFLILRVTVIGLLIASGYPVSIDAASIKPLELLGGTAITSEPDSMIYRCQGYNCNISSEIDFYATPKFSKVVAS